MIVTNKKLKKGIRPVAEKLRLSASSFIIIGDRYLRLPTVFDCTCR